MACIELATRQLSKFAALVSNCKALFPRWLQDRLAVIPTVYRQQKEMYDNHSHSCHRLARWLVLFFLKLFSFFASPAFSADPNYV